MSVATTGTVSVGVVGLGCWGPNLARNLAAVAGCEVRWCCDTDAAARERLGATLRQPRLTGHLEDLLADPELDAVVVATPVPTHADLAQRVLAAGKHCFVEKPMAQSLADAERVVEAAREAGRLLMVGHLLEYHPGMRRLEEIVRSGHLGAVRYVYSKRLNLGQLRSDENALWSLGAHDVSVILRLAGEDPHELEARGECYTRPGVEDVVFCFLRFPSGLAAHMHLSWLDPHKERRLTVVGAQQMATFDDMLTERKLTVYDKGFDESTASYGEYITRSGDLWSPRIPSTEPLRVEVEHFVQCVREGRRPDTDEHSGLRVVRVLEELQRSLDASARAEGREAGVAHG